jgi:hypothetical protein
MHYRLLIVFTALLSLAGGFLLANHLLADLAISVNTEREFLVEHLTAEMQLPGEQKTAEMKAIYLRRQQNLQSKIEQTRERISSIHQYIEPLEKELILYQKAFQAQAATEQSERMQLNIDIVSRYRDYQRALSQLGEFIPLVHSDSPLSQPSIHLDLIQNTGGHLARTHNRLLEQPRNDSFAQFYETQLQQFLTKNKFSNRRIECRSSLCELQLSQQWDDPYYLGFNAFWDQLNQQPWFNLTTVAEAHQYRGKGHQIQIWILEAN